MMMKCGVKEDPVILVYFKLSLGLKLLQVVVVTAAVVTVVVQLLTLVEAVVNQLCVKG
jgi:hypothetical protein